MSFSPHLDEKLAMCPKMLSKNPQFLAKIMGIIIINHDYPVDLGQLPQDLQTKPRNLRCFVDSGHMA